MKLNIEAMTREVGAVGGVLSMGRHDGTLFSTAELEAFARLIVERCAQECDRLSYRSDRVYIAADASAAIRNLLED